MHIPSLLTSSEHVCFPGESLNYPKLVFGQFCFSLLSQTVLVLLEMFLVSSKRSFVTSEILYYLRLSLVMYYQCKTVLT